MRRSSSVLVGRDDDLQALVAAVADRGARPVVLLGGEAGIGKSRLIAELLAHVATTGGMTTVGSCIRLGADVLPYAPFVDALGRYVEALGAGAEGTPAAVPDALATLLPDPAAIDSERELVSRGRMYEAVRSLLDGVPGGLILVLEDIHWADRSSLELLAYLASRLRRARTAIVATFRTDELHRRHPLVPVLAELTRSGRATRLDLERLDREQVGSLVRAINGDTPAALIAAIAARSEGNPFLIEELIALGAPPSRALPGTLRDLLLARLGSLPELSRRALAILAVVGRPADAELIEAAWEGTPAELEAALRLAVDHAILVVEPSGSRLAFRHALIGEAVADDLLPGQRVRLHAALARALADRPHLASPTRAGAAAEVAHHLLEAHDLTAALSASVAAGDAAMAARAYPEARELYERALELLERIHVAGEGDASGRIDLLDAAAEASFRGGDATRAVALGRQAVAAAEERVGAARMGHLLSRLMEWSAATGELEELAALGERAVSLVPSNPPTVERAHVLLSLASSRAHAGLHRECLELARASAEVAVACGAIGNEAGARSLVAMALTGLGRDREAIDEIDEAVRLADRSRGSAEVGLTRIGQAAAYSVAGRFADLPDALPRRDRHSTTRACATERVLAGDPMRSTCWHGRAAGARQRHSRAG